MGQITNPSVAAILLTSNDRLTSSNAAGGLPTGVAHVIAFGENAGLNMGVNAGYMILFGVNAGRTANNQNLIAIGQNAAAGGLTNVSGNDGLIAIGESALAAATGVSGLALQSGPSVVLGRDIMPLLTTGPRSSVLVGADIARLVATNAGHFSDNVMLGNGIFGDLTTFASQTITANVVIGSGAYRNAITSNLLIPEQCVIIGADAVAGTGGAGKALRTVAIGYQIASAMRGTTDCVFIGSQNSQGVNIGGNLVMIGANVTCDASGTDNVVIGGSNTHISGGGGAFGNISIGASGTGNIAGNYGIRLGRGAAGNPRVATPDHTFLVETYDSVTRRTFLFGDMNGGNLVIGRSVDATDRDTPGTNLLKLITGTVTGVAPAGGGIFYTVAVAGTAGVLRWVNAANVNQVIAGLVCTVAQLPAGVGAGSRATVTDALGPAFGAAVVGGGAVVTPVYYTGAAWNVG